MNDERIEEKIYDCFEGTPNPEILDIEKQIVELDDQIELLIPPDYYKQYIGIVLKQEELRHKRNFLEFKKIYKEAFKDGLSTGVDLDV